MTSSEDFAKTLVATAMGAAAHRKNREERELELFPITEDELVGLDRYLHDKWPTQVQFNRVRVTMQKLRDRLNEVRQTVALERMAELTATPVAPPKNMDDGLRAKFDAWYDDSDIGVDIDKAWRIFRAGYLHSTL